MRLLQTSGLPTAALTGEGTKPRFARVPAVYDCSVGDDVVQRAAITPQQDAEEAQPQQEEAQRKRKRSQEPALGAHTAAVLADNLHPEQHHAGRLPTRGPEVSVIEELPGEERDHHPRIGPAPVDGTSGQHAGGERGGAQDQHEHPDAYSAVDYERDETRGEPGVLATQVFCFPRADRNVWLGAAAEWHGLRYANATGHRFRQASIGIDRRRHGSSEVFGNSGGSARPVWLR